MMCKAPNAVVTSVQSAQHNALLKCKLVVREVCSNRYAHSACTKRKEPGWGTSNAMMGENVTTTKHKDLWSSEG